MSESEWVLPAFIQALMSRGSFAEKDAKILIGELLTASNTAYEPEDLQEWLGKLISLSRNDLSEFDYDVRVALDQTSGERIYCLVNAVSDPATQLATTYGPDELSFIRRVLGAMFSSYNSPRMEIMAATKEQCLRLSRAPPRASMDNDDDDDDNDEPAPTQAPDRGITHGDVNRIMDELVTAGWMTHSREGFYTLSTRGLSELSAWLTDTFNDGEPGTWQRIKNCMACREILTQGLRCANVECLVRLHDRCATTLFASRRDKDCPTCQTPWTGKNYVGERAITEGRLYQQSRGVRGRRSNVADEAFKQGNGGEDDESGEEVDMYE